MRSIDALTILAETDWKHNVPARKEYNYTIYRKMQLCIGNYIYIGVCILGSHLSFQPETCSHKITCQNCVEHFYIENIDKRMGWKRILAPKQVQYIVDGLKMLCWFLNVYTHNVLWRTMYARTIIKLVYVCIYPAYKRYKIYI